MLSWDPGKHHLQLNCFSYLGAVVPGANRGKTPLLPVNQTTKVMFVKYPISPESTVTLHLSLALEDGTVVESTFDDEPLTFTMGDGTLVEGLELGLYGLKAGATQRLVLQPEQAFGLHDPDKRHQLARADFSAELQLEPGVIIGFDTPSGEELSGTIVSLTDETVDVDFNHPLAGRVVVFEVEIIAVVLAQE
jgi:FKBP-type peptidyl-prolyl cis-trans isomerase SlpA